MKPSGSRWGSSSRYLVLNAVVVGGELIHLALHSAILGQFKTNLLGQQSNPIFMVAIALLLFPKLALGLSGFETGVAVMPLVRGDDTDHSRDLVLRVRNTRTLLRTAAIIMSVLLIGSSIVAAALIPAHEMHPGGAANGRALAYLAHRDFGEVFGSVYDGITIAILWFAGASALAGLLNLVPRYLPRYGMAPDWARATRPLVLLFTFIAVVVTIIFDADVDKQGGAYATGVLMLMSSAALAVMIGQTRRKKAYLLPIALVFVYTTIANIIERPEGIKIATWFIVTIIATSLISRVLRSTEIRIEGIDYDKAAARFIDETAKGKTLRIIASRPNTGTWDEYARKLADAFESHHLPPDDAIVFLEVRSSDSSEFANVLHVSGVDVGGHHVLRCSSPAIPNAIAGLLLDLRNRTETLPHAYFGWTEGNPITYLLKFLAFGEGDTAPVCREVLRQAEHDPMRRPRIHVG